MTMHELAEKVCREKLGEDFEKRMGALFKAIVEIAEEAAIQGYNDGRKQNEPKPA